MFLRAKTDLSKAHIGEVLWNSGCKSTLVLYLLRRSPLILAGHLIAILEVQDIYAVKMIKHLLL